LRILTVDIGTGTQDVFLYDSRLDIENGFKLVLPSPTMMVSQRIKAATAARSPVALLGSQMGGGPSAWAAEAHARAGLAVYATPQAALTLDDDLDKVASLGVRLISEDESRLLKSDVVRIELKDFDFAALSEVFGRFGVGVNGLDAVAVAVFDHGAAPRGISDRQFRFDYLDRRIGEKNALSAFGHLSTEVPAIMSRLLAVAHSGTDLDSPMIVMDTAPAAVLGATFDPQVRRRRRQLIVNVGNFHTLAFRLTGTAIDGVFEHHTGEIDLPKLEALILALADGSLKHEDVFNDMGHGALVYSPEALEFGTDTYDVVVTGPRRSMFRPRAVTEGASAQARQSRIRPYFAVPFGDMMLAGCFGLLAATAELLPQLGDQIRAGMSESRPNSAAPWDAS